jgi:hypothetical protein
MPRRRRGSVRLGAGRASRILCERVGEGRALISDYSIGKERDGELTCWQRVTCKRVLCGRQLQRVADTSNHGGERGRGGGRGCQGYMPSTRGVWS